MVAHNASEDIFSYPPQAAQQKLSLIQEYWFESYQADITTVTFDTVEYLVDTPPGGLKEARELAMEHFLYCPDIVTQGVGTVPNLEKDILLSKVWFFWWD